MRDTNFFAILQYDGRGFAGWQRQPNQRTVQGEVETVLGKLCSRPVTVIAAGRTDTGVHALGQTISFQTEKEWDAADLRRAMNALLPGDVWVSRVAVAPEGFNARRHARSRHYRYVIGIDEEASAPFRLGREWHVNRPLDLTLLDRGAAFFMGEHDFTAFSAVGQEKPHYRCLVSRAEWSRREQDKGVIFHVSADRFLHHMVRFMVGTLVDVGLGNRPLDDIPRLLDSTNNSKTSPPAPPQGLYLYAVDYPQLSQDIK